jgi:hypothetical protein
MGKVFFYIMALFAVFSSAKAAGEIAVERVEIGDCQFERFGPETQDHYGVSLDCSNEQYVHNNGAILISPERGGSLPKGVHGSRLSFYFKADGGFFDAPGSRSSEHLSVGLGELSVYNPDASFNPVSGLIVEKSFALQGSAVIIGNVSSWAGEQISPICGPATNSAAVVVEEYWMQGDVYSNCIYGPGTTSPRLEEGRWYYLEVVRRAGSSGDGNRPSVEYSIVNDAGVAFKTVTLNLGKAHIRSGAWIFPTNVWSKDWRSYRLDLREIVFEYLKSN